MTSTSISVETRPSKVLKSLLNTFSGQKGTFIWSNFSYIRNRYQEIRYQNFFSIKIFIDRFRWWWWRWRYTINTLHGRFIAAKNDYLRCQRD